MSGLDQDLYRLKPYASWKNQENVNQSCFMQKAVKHRIRATADSKTSRKPDKINVKSCGNLGIGRKRFDLYLKEGTSAVKMQLHLQKIKDSCMWLKKKLVRLIETISAIETAAEKDQREMASRERKLIKLASSMRERA